MKQTLCTLFDKNFLLKGLALIFSLKKFMKDFEIYVLTLDDEATDILNKLKIEEIKMISLNEIEEWDRRLIDVKKNRKFQEYCWTLTSNLCRFVLETKKSEMVTYLDADIYFFNSPEIIFKEIGENSITIVEHRFSKNRKFFEKKAGRFNVSWVSFKNDKNGLEAVNWWSERVIEWCYDRYEDGKFGDQRYLDDWRERFNGVYIIQNIGANVAPWNIKDYFLEKQGEMLLVNKSPLIFYHFHRFHLIKTDGNISFTVGNYYINNKVKELIYKPYFESNIENLELVKKIRPDFKISFKKLTFKDYLANILFSNSFLEDLTLKFLNLKSKISK